MLQFAGMHDPSVTDLSQAMLPLKPSRHEHAVLFCMLEFSMLQMAEVHHPVALDPDQEMLPLKPSRQAHERPLWLLEL